MKRCPECRRDYYDDTLLYCLEDGNALVQGAVPSPDEPATAILSVPGAAATGDSAGESPTRAQINTTDKTATLSTGAEAEPQKNLNGGTERQSLSAHRAAKPLFAVLAVIVVAGIGFGIYKFVSGKQSSPVLSFESMKITKLTDTGKAGDAAISPDGKYVVHVKEDAGQESLWVRHIGSGSNVQIIPPAAVEYGRMTFTPDGGYIYFGRREVGAGSYDLYQVPVLGGEQKKLVSKTNSPVTFSPDGKRMAFLRNQGDDSTMMIANADGTGEQPLATLKRPESFKTSGPGWSPDGKVIASGTLTSDEGGRYGRIVGISVEDGSIKQIGSSRWADAGQVGWLSDGSGFITNNFERDSNIAQVFQISYPGGEVQKITNDLLSYHGVSMTADAGSIVVVQEDRVSNIWSAPDGDTSRAKQLTRGSAKWEGRGGLRWTPDGKIVYTTMSGGLNPHIWIMKWDGSDQRRLTQGNGVNPAVSPDGRYVVYSSPSKPVRRIYGEWISTAATQDN
jgi:Tol biopolymer transport system component